MSYNNAVSCRLRGHCRYCPSVQISYNAVPPFFSAEFKSDASPANLREATHQIAISSYISLVDRQRLRRLHSDSMSYTQDKKHETLCVHNLRDRGNGMGDEVTDRDNAVPTLYYVQGATTNGRTEGIFRVASAHYHMGLGGIRG